MARPRSKPTLRSQVAAALDSAATKENVDRIVEEALTGTTRTLVECPHCGESFRAPLPRIGEQVKNLTALLQEAEGRVGDQLPEGTTVIIQRPAN